MIGHPDGFDPFIEAQLDAFKKQARLLKAELAKVDTQIKHGHALNLVAVIHGYTDWNTLCGLYKSGQPLQQWNLVEAVKRLQSAVGRYGLQLGEAQLLALILSTARIDQTLYQSDPDRTAVSSPPLSGGRRNASSPQMGGQQQVLSGHSRRVEALDSASEPKDEL